MAILGASYFFFKLSTTIHDSYDPIKRGKKSAEAQRDLAKQGSFTVLLVGTDVKDASNKYWRSDTMILAAINPKKKSMKMISIPRDTYASIANTPNGFKTKINAAPYYGIKAGVGPMTNTVYTLESYLNTPIKYYVKINFNGFIDITDTLGGTDVNVPFDFNLHVFNKQYYFKKGPAHLNGHEALAYVRMRKGDPRGDAGRNDRQREVIQSLMKKSMSFHSIGKMDDVLKAVGDNITHNMKLSEMLELQSIYRSIPKKNTETLTLHGYNSNQKNAQKIYYYYVSEQERLRVSLTLRKQLDLPLQTFDGKPYEGDIPDKPSNMTPQQPNSSTPATGNPTTSP
ncbi:LCP family protein [Marininema halotolerans]|uniref:Cell envelope-related function transcriptional attenuator common domain-containing protein n=1 Tax=Marininema halotolerans TaxID=1155944 RepID=A0A1I6PXI7_9BACL|nr:LCP family protein [Marininema halotolerans]SFS44941.1 cell envelope-related function transcriptional attenuator common domain-containing protein [Marininema halotolerans]